MCLAIPMMVKEIDGDTAVVEAGGIRKNVRLDLVEGVNLGDYVMIHTGYAIEILDSKEAEETLELIKKVYRAGMTNDAEGLEP
ncbi:MAG: HypC/HybG/HupF family hydrogenase formation chaperone [Candidatus Krumholzibacteriota bacterium]|nr:HypC/HybG/HupF family hydrogenase formation chaperone [Candidatus Krumholzibacteriota bacterium]